MSFPNLKQKFSPSEDSSSFEPFIISKIYLIVHRKYRSCANFLTLLKAPTYTLSFLPGVVCMVGFKTRLPNQLIFHVAHLFYSHLLSKLEVELEFRCLSCNNFPFSAWALWKWFSAFLTPFNLIAALLKTVKEPKSSSGCWWYSIKTFFLNFVFLFLSLSFYTLHGQFCWTSKSILNDFLKNIFSCNHLNCFCR